MQSVMDENNPENLLINGTQLNSFYNSSTSCKNIFEVNKLRATAVAESISGSSKSQLPIYINNKYSKKGLKGKAKILSVIHIPSPNDKGNKHVPLILKKSNKIKLKVDNPIAVCNFANPVQNEIEKLSQSLFNEEILNTDQIHSVDMSQSYFNNQYNSNQLENIYDSGFVNNSFASEGEIAEISDGLDSNSLCYFDTFINEGSSSGFETQAKNSKVPKLAKVMRLVSILKSNQPVQNTSSLVIEELESGETEVPLPEMESSSATESVVSFLSETFSPIPTTEASSSATDSASFETVSSLTDKEEITEESSESETEMDATTFVTEATVHATGSEVAHSEMQISRSDEANASRTSELVTVASDDIPYNAEIEIDSNEANKSFEVNVTPTNNNNNKGENRKMEDKDVDALEFNVLKASSKRRLFLEKVDVEFCKAAQRKVRGIENFGLRGYNAVRIFNDVMKIIPDESPATIHALLIAFEHQVGPVITHLRYIQRSREMMNARREFESSSRATDVSAASFKCKNKKHPPKVNSNRKPHLIATEEIQNKAQTQVEAQLNIPNTRKKKIFYNVDLELSDNYADDSDEDYVPGQDVTPKKKKRPKRRYVSTKRKTSTFEEVPIHATPPSAVNLNNINEEPEASTSGGPSSYDPYSFDAEIIEEEKRIIRYNRRGSLCGHKRPDPNEDGDDVDGSSVFPQEGEIYKAEPVPREVLDLVKFKKKRAPNSHVVPPVQKYMYAHDGRQNFRYMTLTKH